MTATYQRELAGNLLEEIKPLLEMHWKEIAHYPDILLDPDYATYLKMEDAGLLRCFTVRLDRILTGYLVYFLYPNIHYKSSRQAVQDILYVRPDRRGMMLGKRLIEFAREELTNEKVQVEYQHIKAKHKDTLGRLLEHTGSELMDLVYTKRLDRRN